MSDASGDLFGIWRTLMQQWETQTNAALTEATGNEAFSREMNRSMAGGLKMQAAFNEAVEKALSTLNLPSRDDVARLATQLSIIERKLDTLTAHAPGATLDPPPTRARRHAPCTQCGGRQMTGAPDVAQLGRLRQEVERALQRNIKGWDYLASPGKAGGVCERSLIAKRGTMNLYHYEPLIEEIYRTPLMLVMATSNPSYVFDLLPGQSLVEFLLRRGHDIYVLEWTPPAREENRLRLEDYVLDFIPGSVQAIANHSGVEDISIAGYCMGGMLSLMYASLHVGGPLRNLVCFTTPFDFSQFGSWKLWSDPRYFDVDQIVDTLGRFPPELFVASVDMLRPVSRITGNVQLWDNLWNDEFVKSQRAFDKWSADTLPIPGELFRQTTKEIVVANKLHDATLKVGGRTVEVASITVPFLHFVAEHDHIVPYAAARDLVTRIGSADKEEVMLKGGHVSLIAGPSAAKRMWPKLDEWLAPRST